MKIGIYSAAKGEKYGWGHYYRSRGLVSVLRGAGHTVFWNDDDTATLDDAIDAGIELDWFLLDHPLEIIPSGLKAKRKGYLAGESDLSRPLSPSLWDLILVQGVLPRKPSEKWIGGVERALIRPEILAIAKLPLPGRRRAFLYPWRDFAYFLPYGWTGGSHLWADGAIVKFGMVSLELAVIGVPQIIVKDGALEPTAYELEKMGMAKIIPKETLSIGKVVKALERRGRNENRLNGIGCWTLIEELERRL